MMLCGVSHVCYMCILKYQNVRPLQYTPYHGLNLTNQENRKLEVFERKFGVSYSPVHCYFIQNIIENEKEQFKRCFYFIDNNTMFQIHSP